MVSGRIRGVALLVRNPDQAILILRELETKPHLGKYAGMQSIPMETSRPNEPDCLALERLVQEELPGLEDQVRINPQRVGWYRIVPRVWVSLYIGVISSSDLPTSQVSEVGGYAWVDQGTALRLWLRQGAREMITDGIHNANNVVRRRCSPPPLQPTTVPSPS